MVVCSLHIAVSLCIRPPHLSPSRRRRVKHTLIRWCAREKARMHEDEFARLLNERVNRVSLSDNLDGHTSRDGSDFGPGGATLLGAGGMNGSMGGSHLQMSSSNNQAEMALQQMRTERSQQQEQQHGSKYSMAGLFGPESLTTFFTSSSRSKGTQKKKVGRLREERKQQNEAL